MIFILLLALLPTDLPCAKAPSVYTVPQRPSKSVLVTTHKIYQGVKEALTKELSSHQALSAESVMEALEKVLREYNVHLILKNGASASEHLRSALRKAWLERGAPRSAETAVLDVFILMDTQTYLLSQQNIHPEKIAQSVHLLRDLEEIIETGHMSQGDLAAPISAQKILSAIFAYTEKSDIFIDIREPQHNSASGPPKSTKRAPRRHTR